MSEMVERVAIAIFSQGAATEWAPSVGDEIKDTCRKQARAAIAVEPTQGMFMVGGDVAVSNRGKDHLNPRPGRRIGDLAARDVWRRMAKEALK